MGKMMFFTLKQVLTAISNLNNYMFSFSCGFMDINDFSTKVIIINFLHFENLENIRKL